MTGVVATTTAVVRFRVPLRIAMGGVWVFFPGTTLFEARWTRQKRLGFREEGCGLTSTVYVRDVRVVSGRRDAC